MRYSILTLLFISQIVISNPSVISKMTGEAHQRGVYEIEIAAPTGDHNPFFDVDFKVLFIRPDETRVSTGGFYDGDGVFKARAYCDQTGEWIWRSISNLDGLNGQSGTFTVIESDLPGKLRIHPDDPYQLSYDNGDWFLHIGDTGYRYVTATEPEWQPYIDQAARAGFTKIRTWFCQARSDVQILFGPQRQSMNL